MSKQEFAEHLGISRSTLERREKEVAFFLPRGLLCPKTRTNFIEKLDEWEQTRQASIVKKKRDG